MNIVTAKKLSDLEETVRRQEKQITILIRRIANLERENTKRKNDIDRLG